MYVQRPPIIINSLVAFRCKSFECRHCPVLAQQEFMTLGAFQVFEEGRTLASTKVKDTYEDDYDLGD